MITRAAAALAGLLLAAGPAAAQQVWFQWVSIASSKDKAQLFRQAFTKEGDSWKRGAAYDSKRQCSAVLPQGDKGTLTDGTYTIMGKDPTAGFIVMKYQCWPESVDPNKQ